VRLTWFYLFFLSQIYFKIYNRNNSKKISRRWVVIKLSFPKSSGDQYTGWAKSRYTGINYILYTYFWPTLYYGYSFQLCNTNCFISILFQSPEINVSFVLCIMTRELDHNKSRKIYTVFSVGGSATQEVSGDDKIVTTAHHYTIRTPSPHTFNEWSPADCTGRFKKMDSIS